MTFSWAHWKLGAVPLVVVHRTTPFPVAGALQFGGVRQEASTEAHFETSALWIVLTQSPALWQSASVVVNDVVVAVEAFALDFVVSGAVARRTH